MADRDPEKNYAKVKAWRARQPNIRAIRAEEARKYRAKYPEKCAETSARYWERHKERLRSIAAERARNRRKNDPEGQKRRNSAFKARFRAKQEEIMGRPRPRYCELCGEAGTGRGNKPHAGICFDHCHKSGKPRGWLCDRCNKVLGLVKDSSALLRKMVRYLESHTDVKAHNETAELTPIERLCRARQVVSCP